MEKVFSLVRPNIFLLGVVTLRKTHSQKELENRRVFINLAVSPTWVHRRPQKSFKIDVLTDFAEFTGKQLCRSLFFNRFTDLQPDVLSCDNIAKFLRITFSLEQLWATTSPHVWAWKVWKRWNTKYCDPHVILIIWKLLKPIFCYY